MATDSRSLVFLQTTDGEFRTWVAGLIDQMVDIGLTQTADTGQIDTATVAKPGAISTSMGYVIFRLNDASQATKPIFFKVEFGSGSAAATTPAIWYTLGTSSDGAGTIGGTIYRVRQTVVMAAGNSTSWPQFACWNATMGVLWLNWTNSQSATGTVGIWIMRGCNPDTGAVEDNILLTAIGTNSINLRMFDLTIGGTLFETPAMGHFQYTLSSSEGLFTHEGRLVAVPCSGGTETGYRCSFPGVFLVHATHVPTYMTCYITPHATEHTYLSLTTGGAPISLDAAASTNSRALLLWE